MSSAHERERLPCGARLETLLLQVTDDERPADPTHQAHCPYCQSTLRRLRAGWGGVVALREEPVAVPSRLTALIMARVRALAAQLSDSILIGHARGETRVSHAVISRVVARTAGSVPGVILASARALPHDPPEPIRLSVSIRLVARFGVRLEPLAEAVRHEIRRRISTLTGAEIVRIDVHVADVEAPRDR
jgi:uncharacterized alkaline shock family protein YloU